MTVRSSETVLPLSLPLVLHHFSGLWLVLCAMMSNHRPRAISAGAPALIEHKNEKFVIIHNPTASTVPNFIAVSVSSVDFLTHITPFLSHSLPLISFLTWPSLTIGLCNF